MRNLLSWPVEVKSLLSRLTGDKFASEFKFRRYEARDVVREFERLIS